jgi:hypothetical protein
MSRFFSSGYQVRFEYNNTIKKSFGDKVKVKVEVEVKVKVERGKENLTTKGSKESIKEY